MYVYDVVNVSILISFFIYIFSRARSLHILGYLPDIGIDVSFAGFGGRGGGVDRFLAILWYLPFYGTTILSNMLNTEFPVF